MTTLAWAASQANLADIDLDAIMTSPPKPTITMVDVIVYGYFDMLPQNLDVFPSKDEVEHLLPGAKRLQEWVCATFAPDAAGNVSHHMGLQQHEKDGVNPYMLQPAVTAVNSARALVTDWVTLEKKYDRLTSLLEIQVDSMIAKLEEHKQTGMCSEAKLEKSKLAAQQWKADKLKDLSLDIDEKKQAAMIAVEAAAREMLQLWLRVREKVDEAFRRSCAATQLQDTLNDSQLDGHGDVDMDDLAESFENEMIAELDANLAMMKLHDEAYSQPTYAPNSSSPDIHN